MLGGKDRDWMRLKRGDLNDGVMLMSFLLSLSFLLWLPANRGRTDKSHRIGHHRVTAEGVEV